MVAPYNTAALAREADHLAEADRFAVCLIWGIERAWIEWMHASQAPQSAQAEPSIDVKAGRKFLRSLEQSGEAAAQMMASEIRSFLQHHEKPRRGRPISRFTVWLADLLVVLRNLGAEPVFNRHKREAARPVDLFELLSQLVCSKEFNVVDLLEFLRPLMPPQASVTIDFDDVEAVNAVAQKLTIAPRFIPNKLPLSIEVRCTEARKSPVTLASFLSVNGAVDRIRGELRRARPH
jgi:hypothetical protein